MSKKAKKKNYEGLKDKARNPNIPEVIKDNDVLIVEEDLDEEENVEENKKQKNNGTLKKQKKHDEELDFSDENEDGKIEDSKVNNKKESNINEKTLIQRTTYLFRTFKTLAIFIAIAVVIIITINIAVGLDDKESFHAVSLKEFKTISEKSESLLKAYQIVNDAFGNNLVLESTNLNLNCIYDKVTDPDEKLVAGASRLVPIPVLSDENKVKEEKIESTAMQIFEKLQNRYKTLITAFQNLACVNPVQIVRQYHYDGYSIIGKYCPGAPGHIKGKRHTYFIQNFTNVNMNFFDGDGNKLTEGSNIKDIMSMASVYSYYKNPYDYNNFIRHCYDLFDNSYSFVASISEVYYCSGCMHVDDITNEDSAVPTIVTYNKISRIHSEQKVQSKEIPYKAGTLKRMDDDTAPVIQGSYDDYINGIFEGKTSDIYNYCPGHVDLVLNITVLTLDASRGLTSIDSNFGNKGVNFTKNWHGWDAFMKKKARTLANKDWEKEYGIDTSYKILVKPLTREEINYYMNRLPQTISLNRRLLIETALKSVGKIPYYYGGKTSKFGYDSNEFGSKVKPDYIGRSLKGLDCSGWVNWVYMTAFNKYMIKSEGTAKLAGEGQKITRKELLPGDLIVRPGIDSHVMMFLEWAEGNKVKVIHENGSVDNVSIATFDAYYPHYRRILNS